MGRRTLLSVVLPTCDRPRELERAVRSLVHQRGFQMEVCVVNDGEGDITRSLALLARRPATSVVRVDTTGGRCLAAARNAGLEVASGKYVTFLDDDDFFLPGYLVQALQTIERREGCTAVYTPVLSHFTRKGTHWMEKHFTYPCDAGFLRVMNAHPIIGVLHQATVDARFDVALRRAEDWAYMHTLVFGLGMQPHFTGITGPVYVRSDATLSMTTGSLKPFGEAYEQVVSLWDRRLGRPTAVTERYRQFVRAHHDSGADTATRCRHDNYEQLLHTVRRRYFAEMHGPASSCR